MKIKLRRPFTYQVDSQTTKTLPAGEHDVTEYVAGIAVRFGGAAIIAEKKAPKAKARGTAPENKTRVAKSAKRRGRPRSKPDA